MPDSTLTTRSLQTYAKLATLYDRQGQPKLRDWFVVLAADAALALGNEDQAERLRQRLLQWSPHHLLRPFGSFAEAMQSADVQDYVADLRRNYPLETAEKLLHEPPPRPTGGEPDLKVFREQTPTVPDQAEPMHHTSKPDQLAPMPISAAPASSAPLARASREPAPPVRAATAMPQMVSVPWSEPAPFHVEEPTALGYWLSTALFVLILSAGLGLGAIVLVRPLLS